MPGKGYSTIGLKPSVFSLLQQLTDTFYPGMFLPSTMIITMNEVKLGYYSIGMHTMKVDLSGRYHTLTIRSDVKTWLEENYEKMSEEYEEKYNTNCFAHFISYFLANLFQSKLDSQRNIIRLKESEFIWLQKEYKKHKEKMTDSFNIPSFERFADSFIKELFNKIKTAREVLST